MAVLDINWNPSRTELRWFAVLQIVFFGLVATVLYRRTGSATGSLAIVAVSALVGVVGFFVPRLARAVYVSWMVLVYPIGWVVSHVLMGLIYFLVVTPIGRIMRLCGRDPLRRKIDRQASSYWVPRQADEDSRRYFRQF